MIRNYGSRHSGSLGFLAVRVTALFIAAGLLGIVALLWGTPAFTYTAWRHVLSDTALRLCLSLWLVAVMAHAYLGVDSILKDYVHSAAMRFLALMGLGVILLSLTIYGVTAFYT